MTFIEPNIDLAFFAIRIALAIIFFAHGPMKLQRAEQVAGGLGMSKPQVMLLGTVETLGALSVLLGIWPQVGAAALAVVMLGAIYYKTQKWGKNFTGDGGWELEFVILTLAMAVLLGAPATYSIV